MSHFKRFSIQNRAAKRGKNEPPPELSKLKFDGAAPRDGLLELATSGTAAHRRDSPSLFLTQESEDTNEAAASVYDVPSQFTQSSLDNGEIRSAARQDNFQRGMSDQSDSPTHWHALVHAEPNLLSDAPNFHPERQATASTVMNTRLGPSDGIRPDIDTGKPNRNDVLATLFMGSPLEELAPVMFRGLVWPAQINLYRIQSEPKSLKIKLETLCSPDVYQEHFTPTDQQFLGSGYIQGFFRNIKSGNQGSTWAVKRLHKALISGHLGAWFHSRPEFSMIVFPNHSPEWQFLSNQLRPVPQNALLHFVLQAAVSPDAIVNVNDDAQARSPTPSPPVIPAPSSPPLTEAVSVPYAPIETIPTLFTPVADGVDSNNTMLEQYGITYRTLIHQPKSKDTATNDTFFIIYPPDRTEELNTILTFLKVNSAKKVIVFHDAHGGQDLSRGDPDWSGFSGLLKDRFPGVILVCLFRLFE